MIYLFGHSTVKNIILALSDALHFNGIKNQIKENITEETKHLPWVGILHRSPIMPSRYIAYNSESMRLPKAYTIINKVIRNAIEVWDYSKTNVNILNLSHVKHVPLGYSPVYETLYKQNTKHEEPKDIDIFIYAWYTDRRKQIIETLRNKNLNVVWLGEDNLREYGSERDKLISRSKIVLSICKTEPEIYGSNDFSRLSYLIANRIFTISEPIGDTGTESLWEDKIVMPKYNNLVDQCLYYLDKDKLRNEICEKAYDFAVNHFNLRKLIPLDKIHEINNL